MAYGDWHFACSTPPPNLNLSRGVAQLSSRAWQAPRDWQRHRVPWSVLSSVMRQGHRWSSWTSPLQTRCAAAMMSGHV